MTLVSGSQQTALDMNLQLRPAPSAASQVANSATSATSSAGKHKRGRSPSHYSDDLPFNSQQQSNSQTGESFEPLTRILKRFCISQQQQQQTVDSNDMQQSDSTVQHTNATTTTTAVRPLAVNVSELRFTSPLPPPRRDSSSIDASQLQHWQSLSGSNPSLHCCLPPLHSSSGSQRSSPAFRIVSHEATNNNNAATAAATTNPNNAAAMSTSIHINSPPPAFARTLSPCTLRSVFFKAKRTSPSVSSAGSGSLSRPQSPTTLALPQPQHVDALHLIRPAAMPSYDNTAMRSEERRPLSLAAKLQHESRQELAALHTESRIIPLPTHCCNVNPMLTVTAPQTPVQNSVSLVTASQHHKHNNSNNNNMSSMCCVSPDNHYSNNNNNNSHSAAPMRSSLLPSPALSVEKLSAMAAAAAAASHPGWPSPARRLDDTTRLAMNLANSNNAAALAADSNSSMTLSVVNSAAFASSFLSSSASSNPLNSSSSSMLAARHSLPHRSLLMRRPRLLSRSERTSILNANHAAAASGAQQHSILTHHLSTNSAAAFGGQLLHASPRSSTRSPQSTRSLNATPERGSLRSSIHHSRSASHAFSQQHLHNSTSSHHSHHNHNLSSGGGGIASATSGSHKRQLYDTPTLGKRSLRDSISEHRVKRLKHESSHHEDDAIATAATTPSSSLLGQSRFGHRSFVDSASSSHAPHDAAATTSGNASDSSCGNNGMLTGGAGSQFASPHHKSSTAVTAHSSPVLMMQSLSSQSQSTNSDDLNRNNSNSSQASSLSATIVGASTAATTVPLSKSRHHHSEASFDSMQQHHQHSHTGGATLRQSQVDAALSRLLPVSQKQQASGQRRLSSSAIEMPNNFMIAMQRQHEQQQHSHTDAQTPASAQTQSVALHNDATSAHIAAQPPRCASANAVLLDDNMDSVAQCMGRVHLDETRSPHSSFSNENQMPSAAAAAEDVDQMSTLSLSSVNALLNAPRLTTRTTKMSASAAPTSQIKHRALHASAVHLTTNTPEFAPQAHASADATADEERDLLSLSDLSQRRQVRHKDLILNTASLQHAHHHPSHHHHDHHHGAFVAPPLHSRSQSLSATSSLSLHNPLLSENPSSSVFQSLLRLSRAAEPMSIATAQPVHHRPLLHRASTTTAATSSSSGLSPSVTESPSSSPPLGPSSRATTSMKVSDQASSFSQELPPMSSLRLRRERSEAKSDEADYGGSVDDVASIQSPDSDGMTMQPESGH